MEHHEQQQQARQADANKAAKLERKLLHAIKLEKRAQSRVKRTTTTLHKWASARRRYEKQIGEQEVRRIVNRLSLGVVDNELSK